MWTLCVLAALAADPAPEVRIVTLGDSITRGVRPGVEAKDTFQVQLETLLTEKKKTVKVINVGIGGERTDQGLARLARVLAAHKPHIVAIMYGHNDSHIDRGKTEPRLTAAQYEANLRKIIQALQDARVQPVLMTPPCYAKKSRQGGVAENPNVQLVKCAEVVRALARELKLPLIDHYAHWHRRLDDGDDTAAWTTDLYHPNRAGHAEIAATMLPVLLKLLDRK
ncbi:MAG: GDSL-type esterase/lipase family protein [Gemmataceae bacterium]